MHRPIAFAKFLSVAFVLQVVSMGAGALTCDELRVSIESKIRNNGVADFTVSVVAASASAPGKVVGTCEQGAMKLVYERTPGRSTPTAPVASAPRPSPAVGPRVITECADGRIIYEGTCKK